MFSHSRATVMASRFFRSLHSAFRPSPAQACSTSAATECSHCSSGIDAEQLLPLLALFHPSDLADVLILAAHYARTQQWDSVHAVYQQLDSALRARGAHHPAVAAGPASALPAYAPLVSSLSTDECEAWLAVLQQCQRDATMLQPRPPSSHATDDQQRHDDSNGQDEQSEHCSQVEAAAAVTAHTNTDNQSHASLHEQQQLNQSTDPVLEAELHASSTAAESEQQQLSATAFDGVTTQRPQKRARRKRAEAEWGESMPAKRKVKRQARQDCRSTDGKRAGADTPAATEQYGTDMHATTSQPAHISTGKAEEARQGRGLSYDDTVRDQSNDPVLHTTLTDSSNKQVGEPPAKAGQDEQRMEGEPEEVGGGTAAALAVRSRWKRPSKRLVRFRVIAGDGELSQIEAQQEEYMRLNGLMASPASHQPVIDQQLPVSTLATTDNSPEMPATASIDLSMVEPAATDAASHTDAVRDALAAMHDAASVESVVSTS